MLPYVNIRKLKALRVLDIQTHFRSAFEYASSLTGSSVDECRPSLH